MVEFTKKQLGDLRRDMQHVLDSAQFGGCKIHVGNCTYLGGEATFKVTVLLDGAETKEQKYLTDMARLYNLDTTKIAETQGKKFSLIGYKTKAPKMPWIVQDLLTGHEYKLTHDQAERLFKKPVEVTS